VNALWVDSPAAAPPRTPRAATATSTTSAPAPVTPASGVTVPQQRILNALAWWLAFGLDQPTNEQVGFVAGYAPGSGNYNNIRGGLRAAGLIDYPSGGRLALTDAGLGVAEAPRLAVTREAFHDQVRAKMSPSQLKLIEPILAAYPEALKTDQLAEAAGYAAGSGNFNNLRGSLRTIGLIDYPASGQVRAADWLFPGGDNA
jgi:hypothetical protein